MDVSKIVEKLQEQRPPCPVCSLPPKLEEYTAIEKTDTEEGLTLCVWVSQCDCQNKIERERNDRNLISQLFSESGIPGRYRNIDIDKFEITKDNRDQFEAVRQYEKDLLENIRNGVGIGMFGTVGTGKTSCGCWLLERAIKKFIDSKYLSYRAMVIQLEELPEWECNRYMNQFSSATFLMIDDVGIIPIEKKAKHFNALIEKRWEKNMATIFTMNLEYMQTIQGDVESRIKGLCRFTESTGKDYRGKS